MPNACTTGETTPPGRAAHCGWFRCGRARQWHRSAAWRCRCEPDPYRKMTCDIVTSTGVPLAQHFRTPPNWPTAPEGWVPPEGWQPDPAWGPAPAGWQFWTADGPAPAPMPAAQPTPQPPAPQPPAGIEEKVSIFKARG